MQRIFGIHDIVSSLYGWFMYLNRRWICIEVVEFVIFRLEHSYNNVLMNNVVLLSIVVSW